MIRCLQQTKNGVELAFAQRCIYSRSRVISFASLFLFALSVLGSVGCAGVASSTSPSNNSASSGHSVTLTWNPATAEVGAYNVYRSESLAGPFQKVKTIEAPRHDFVDREVAAGTTYYYVVTSIDGDGRESADSTPAIAKVP
jgi:fibronectin type 3 domain-containing protein